MNLSRCVFAAFLTSLACYGPVARGQEGSVLTYNGHISGHFHLIASDGTVVDSDELTGKPYVLFFGFTHCPDICPTTLADVSLALTRVLDQVRDLKAYFITVDPERDTAETLARYMESFDPHIVGLTGARSDVDEAIRSFGIVARRTEFPNGSYTYGHTASILLIDGNGLIVDRLAVGLGPDALAARLTALVTGTRPSAASR